MNNILDDIFHPDKPICNIPKTTTIKKKDIFKELRPKIDSCLDYDISQTDLKMDAGNTKIHIQQTDATYVPNESKEIKAKIRKRRKGTRYFSGGPPQWEFIDEIWRRQQEEKQKIYRQQLQERFHKRRLEKQEALKKARKNKVNH